MRLTRRSVLLLAAGLLAAVPAPHPGHTSYAEVSCDAKRQELQVSLGMLAIDFEKTLSLRAKKRVNLDKTKDVDKLIEAYLKDRFVVTLADGSKPKPKFVGHEDQRKNVWIHFTVPLVAKKAKPPAKGKAQRPAKGKAQKGSLLQGVKLHNRVLMEINREQRNMVELREGTWRHFLTFTEKEPVQALREAAKQKIDKGTPTPARPPQRV